MTTSRRKVGDTIASPPETLEVALSLAAAGWYVFPVKLVVVTKPDGSVATDKRPVVKWLEGATRDAEQIATWFSAEFPGAWVGVHAEKSHLVIVDVDAPKDADDTRDGKLALDVAGIALPKTFKYKTRGGGRHYVYRAPKGASLTIGQNVPVNGVDIRAGRGLVVYYGPKLNGEPKLAKAPKWALLKTATKSSTKHDLDVDAWLARQRDGKAPKELRRHVAEIELASLKHEPMLELVNVLVREGSQGAPGIAPLLAETRAAYIEGRADRARDWDNAVAGSVQHFGAPLTTFEIPKPERKALALAAAQPLKPLGGTAARPIEDNPLAVELAEIFAGSWAYSKATGLLRWRGTVWELEEPLALIEAVRDQLRQVEETERAKALTWRDEKIRQTRLDKLRGLLSARKAKDVAALITGILAKETFTLDAHPDLLNTPSGVVDLRTGELSAHDAALMFTKITAVGYDPTAELEGDWAEALEALPPKARRWMQYRLGQAATGYMADDDKLPLLRGSGDNGKSVIFNGARSALGDYCVTVGEKLLLANPGDHSTETTVLMGARMAVIEELPEGRNLNVKRLKDVIGTPVMSGRRMRRDPIEWAATHSIFLSTNYTPIVAETDHGTWKRLALVVFPYTFKKAPEPLKRPTDRRADPGLRERLKGEPSAAALRWIVEGAMAWYANGRQIPPPPKSVKRDTLTWRRDADPILDFFENRLVLDSGFAITTADLARDFNDHLERNGHKPWSQQTINARFDSHEKMQDVERKAVMFGAKIRPSRPPMALGNIPANTRAWRGVRFASDPARVPSEAELDKATLDGLERRLRG